MYINTVTHGNTVYVWERHPDGRRLVTYPAPWDCYIEDPKGKFPTLKGIRASRFEFDSRAELMNAVRYARNAGRQVHESDIPPDLKILSTNYYEAEVPKIHVSYYDIEVDYKTASYGPDHPVQLRHKDNPTDVKNTTAGVLRQVVQRDTGDLTGFEVYDGKAGGWIPVLESGYLYCGPTGFSSTQNPYAPINSIAVHNDWEDTSYVIAVPPQTWGRDPNKWEQMLDQSLRESGEIILVKDEKELLKLFIHIIQDSDVLCGWNNNLFDNPYVLARVESVLGSKWLRKLCFEGSPVLPQTRNIEIMGKVATTATYGGRVLLDYMELFKKFEPGGRPSFKLEAISEEVLPDLQKLSYDGTLEQLYRNDFNHFLRYNLRDTECLTGFERVKGYVGVANRMCHMSTGRFQDVAGTIRLADMSLINFCHYVCGVIVHDAPVVDGDTSDDDIEDKKAQGAYVLDPKTGEIALWIGSVDINSLYPSVIRGINISPEKLIGQFVETIQAFELIKDRSDARLTLVFDDGRDPITKTAIEWREWLMERKYSISGYGTVFDQSSGPGIIPAILTEWFAMRKEYKAKSEQAANAAAAIAAKYKKAS